MGQSSEIVNLQLSMKMVLSRELFMPGKSYLWWFGWEARITITDPDLIKEVLTKIHVFEKSQMLTRFAREVVGKGVLTTDGEEWALHRRIVNPSFHQEKLKV